MSSSSWTGTAGTGGASIWSLKYTNDLNATFTLSGLGASTGAVTISGNNITVFAGAFSGLASGSAITWTADQNYKFTLDGNLATNASISVASLSVTTANGNASVTGKFSDYYVLSGNSITYHTDKTNDNRVLATISGLSNGAGASVALQNKIIWLDTADLKNSAVSLSAVNFSGIYNVADYGFKLQLDGDSGAGYSAASSLGFGALSGSWAIGNNNKTVIYNSNTAEGWTLLENGSVSYKASVAAGVASITGFQSNITAGIVNSIGSVYATVNGSNTEIIKASASSGVTSFAINIGGLNTLTSSPLTLTVAEGVSSGAYKLVFDSALSASVRAGENGTSIYGMSAQKPYWYNDNGKATWQYDTTEGWSITSDAHQISYIKATSSLHADAKQSSIYGAPDKLAHIEDLASVAAATLMSGLSISGTSTNQVITILNDNVFKTGQVKDYVITLVDDNPNDNNAYTLALSSAITTLASVNNLTNTSLEASGGSGYVKGAVNAYYSMSAVNGGKSNAIAYHASVPSYTLATITGLSPTASLTFQDSVAGAGHSIILLDINDLTDSNVTVTPATGISGTAGYYSLSLALTGAASVYGASNIINPSVAASLGGLSTVSSVSYHQVFGETYKYYTMSGTSAVTYKKPETKRIAYIGGLSDAFATVSGNVSIGADGRTINLKRDALTNNDIVIYEQAVGSTNSYGLSFALISNGSVSSYIGFEDSGNYWGVSGASATYQHYTHEGWSLGSAARIDYTAKSSVDVRFSIDGLTGLGTLTGDEPTVLGGIAVNGMSVTINSKKLDKKDATISGGSSYTFLIQQDGTAAAAASSVIGFTKQDSADAYWYLGESATSGNSSTARLVFNTNEGWSIGSYSTADQNRIIDYVEAKTGSTATAIITIEGLSAGTDSLTAYQNILRKDDNTYSLNAKVLDTLAGSSINVKLINGEFADGTSTAFKLGLANDISNVTNATITTGLSFAGAGGSFTVRDTRAAGWSFLDTANTSLSFISAMDNGLATVTGLSNVVSAENVSLSGKVIGIQLGALSQGNVQLSGNSFSLQLVSPSGTAVDSLGFGLTNDYWNKNASGNFTYQHHTKEGWSLNGTSQITYAGASYTVALFTIAGLSNTVGTSNDANINGGYSYISGITIGSNSVTINTSLFGAQTVNGSVASITGSQSTAYNFYLTDGTNTAASIGAGINKEAKDGSIKNKDGYYWKLDGDSGTAYYTYDTYEGWEVKDGLINYIARSGDSDYENHYVFKIEGLSAGFTQAQLNAINIDDNNVVQLTAEALSAVGESDTFSLKLTGGSYYDGSAASSYKLAIVNPDATTVITGTEIATGLSFTNSGNLYVKDTRAAGWSLAADGKSLNWLAKVDTERASVTGLSVALDDSLVSLQGDTIILTQGALSATNAKLNDLNAGDGVEYKLAFTKNDTVYGLDIGKAYWNTRGGTGGSAYYQQDKNEGWLLTGTENVTYEKALGGSMPYKTFAFITGLSNAITNDALNGNSSMSAGITVDSLGTVTLNERSILSSLTADTVEVSSQNDAPAGITYTLALKDSSVYGGQSSTFSGKQVWDIKDTPNYYLNNGGTLTYQYDTSAGWKLDNNQVIYSISAIGVSIAQITGLSTSVVGTEDDIVPSYKAGSSAYTSVEGVALSGKTFTIYNSALSGVSIALTFGGASGYKLSLDGGISQASFVDSAVSAQISVSAGGTASVLGNTTAYYSLSSSGTDINYHGVGQSVALAIISGLSNKATINGAVEYSDGFIALSQSALNGQNVSLTADTVKGNANYSFLLKEDVLDYDGNFNYSISASVTAVNSGTATVTATTNPYYTANGASVIFHPAHNDVLVKITGLGTGATAGNVTANTDLTSGNTTVTIGKAALTANETVKVAFDDESNASTRSLSLAFNTNEDDDNNTPYTLGLSAGASYWSLSGGDVYFVQDTTAGWKLDNNVITYSNAKTKTLAAITGLSLGDAFKTSNTLTSDGFSAVVQVDGSYFKLSKNALGEKPISFTSAGGYSGLSFASTGGTSVGYTAGSLSFVVENGTAQVQRSYGKYWSLDRDNNIVSYTPAETVVSAIITGLNPNAGTSAVLFDASASAITIAGASALTDKDVVLTDLIASDNYDYKLVFAGGNSKIGFNSIAPVWTTEGTKTVTAKYVQGTDQGWTLTDSLNISYTEAQENENGKVLVQIDGLKKGTTTVDDSANIAGISIKGRKVILSSYVLDGNVAFSTKDSYSVTLGDDVAQTAEYTNYWLAGGTTATFKQNKAAYYSISQKDGSITYNKATTGTVLATITNLKSGNKAVSTGDRPAAINGIAVVPTGSNSGVIYLSEEALGTGTAKLNNKNGSDYKLALVDDVTQAGNAADKGFVYTYGATTTIKSMTKGSYYTAASDGTSVSYTSPADSKTVATIKGLNSGIAADNIGISGTSTIWLTEDALAKKNVTLTNAKKGTVYSLSLSGVSAPTPEESSKTWSLNKTTAVLKANVSDGYTANKTKVTYTKAKSNSTLVTIAGLPKDTALSDIKDENYWAVGSASGTTTFTIREDLLAKSPTKLTLKGTGYAFVLPQEKGTGTNPTYRFNNFLTSTDKAVTEGVNVWRVSGTTAYYKKVIPAHYELSSDGKTFKFVKEADYKENKKSVVYAKITGLAKGLTVENTLVNGSYTTKIGAYDSNGVFVDYLKVSESNKKVTIEKANALPSSGTVALTSGDYSLELGSDGNIKKVSPASKGGVWKVSSTTATLRDGTTAGWAETKKKNATVDNSFTYYKAAQTGDSDIVKLTGLKSGLKVNNDGTITGLDVNSNNKSIKVSRAAVGTKTIAVAKGSDYTLTADDSIASESNGYSYTISGTTLTVKRGKTSGFTASADGKNLTYTKAGSLPTVFTIKGLKKGLTLKDDGTVDGVTISGSSVTLDESVLGTSKISLSNGKNQNFKLALDETAKPKATYGWAVSGSTAYYKMGTTAGYTISGNTITYNKEKLTDNLAVIKNLKNLKVVNGSISGISFSSSEQSSTASNMNDTIYLSSNVLNNKTVTLSNNKTGSFSLSLAGGVTLAKDDTIWKVSGTNATLLSSFGVGYSIGGDSKTIAYNSKETKKDNSPLLVVNGIKKGLIPDSTDGEIAGMAVSAGASTITLDSRVLGTGTASISGGSLSNSYKFALDTGTSDGYAVAITDPNGYNYVVNKTTVTIKEAQTAGYSLAGDSKSVKYSAESIKGGTFATITGLKSGLDTSGISVAKSIASGSSSYTVYLSEDVLGTTDIAIEGQSARLALSSPNTSSQGGISYKWEKNGNGNAVLVTEYKGGYTIASDSKSIKYNAKGIETAVVSGLNDTSYLSVNTADKTITVNSSNAISGNKLTITGGDYTLKVTNGGTSSWLINGNTATLVRSLSSGDLYCDGTTVTKATAAMTIPLFTITGIPTDCTESDLDAITLSNPDSNGVTTVTLSNGVLQDNTSNITLSGNGYKLALPAFDSTKPVSKDTSNYNYNYNWEPHTITDPEWSVKGTTATLATGTTAGYTIGKDGKSATYSAFNTKVGTEYATITGLSSTIKPSMFSGFDAKEKSEFTLTTNMLGTTDVSLSTSKGYSLKLDTGVTQNATEGDDIWAVNGTTVTYKKVSSAYYDRQNTKSIKYIAPKDIETYFEITGLTNKLPLVAAKDYDTSAAKEKVDGITLVDSTKTIVIDAKALTTSTTTGVKFSKNNGDYKLALGSDVAVPTDDDPYWSISGKNATLKKNTSAGYTVSNDAQTINYSAAATNQTLTTISGLKSGLKAVDGVIMASDGETEAFSVDGNVITVNAEALDTVNVTSSSDNYVLALDGDVPTDTETTQVWMSMGNNNYVYNDVTPAHYTANGKTITYSKQESIAGGGHVTVTGVTKFTEDMFNGDTSGGVITLNKANLSTTGEANIASSNPEHQFTFALGDDATAYEINNDTVEWSKASTAATAELKGTATGGYIISEDGTKVTYNKGGTTTFASIKGVADANSFNAKKDVANKTVTLDGEELTEAVTVGGSFAFTFQNNYDNASIVGSADNDSISVNGEGLTITGGAGDDYIDLGNGSATYFYANASGNDVIANFTSGRDTLIVTGTVTSVKKAKDDTNDVIVNLDGGATITLEGYYDSNNPRLKIKDVNGVETNRIITKSSADLMESDNFITGDTDLSAITGGSAKLGDFDAMALANDYTELTKQSSLVSYGKDKK